MEGSSQLHILLGLKPPLNIQNLFNDWYLRGINILDPFLLTCVAVSY